MPPLNELLASGWNFLIQPWWSYNPSEHWFHQPYHWLNLVEGCLWVLFGLLVLRRFVGNRHSLLEPVYALAFFTFGLSDFREAYVLQPWLIGLKGVNLVVIFALRHHLLKRYYPGSKMF